MSRPARALLLICLASLPGLGSGCVAAVTDPVSPTIVEATKTGSGEIRHDLAPLVKRVPALADARAATWYSGTLGDSPGPSTYWIDAVVTLPATRATTLRAELDLDDLGTAPDVVDGLRPLLPEQLLAGDQLDAEYAAGGWLVTTALGAKDPVLVITLIGE